MDVSKGAGIVSGDQLVSYLAKELDADMVALGTDVDGVMKGGELYSRLTRSDLSDLEAHFGSLRGTDITGGMRGKLMELLELAEAGIESQIFNAAKDGNVERALRGEHIGTMVGR
jgi:isopentenyl phosphate kinase